jgi:hypothetical protein
LISTEQDDHAGVIVAVRDSGPGITPENVERVFTSFYTTKPGGTGMGLSICRSIIAAHGGRLWADLNEPRGAVFRFTLPDADLSFAGRRSWQMMTQSLDGAYSEGGSQLLWEDGERVFRRSWRLDNNCAPCCSLCQCGGRRRFFVAAGPHCRPHDAGINADARAKSGRRAATNIARHRILSPDRWRDGLSKGPSFLA